MAGRGKISQQTTYQVSYSGGHWVGNDKLGCAQANAGIRKLLLQLEEEDGGERCAAGTREVEGGDKSEGDEERDEESVGNMGRHIYPNPNPSLSHYAWITGTRPSHASCSLNDGHLDPSPDLDVRTFKSSGHPPRRPTPDSSSSTRLLVLYARCAAI